MSKMPFWLILAALTYLLTAASEGYSLEARLNVANVQGAAGPSKFENGFQIFWRNTPDRDSPDPYEGDPQANVEVFASPEREVAVCHVASALRAADQSFAGVSIYDVSARKPGFIAVAAVYSSTNHTPHAVLLYFDWNGSLLRRKLLNKQPGVQSLAIDSSGNVWALNEFDRESPAKFVFTEFDPSGSIIKGLVRTRRGWSTDESMHHGGQTSFGIASGQVWTWLPKSKTFIAANTASGRDAIYRTGLPKVMNGSDVYARQAVLVRNGQIVIDVGWRAANTPDSAWYLWSSHAGWERLRLPIHGYLYDAEGDKVIFTAPLSPGSPNEFRSERVSTLIATAVSH